MLRNIYKGENREKTVIKKAISEKKGWYESLQGACARSMIMWRIYWREVTACKGGRGKNHKAKEKEQNILITQNVPGNCKLKKGIIGGAKCGIT